MFEFAENVSVRQSTFLKLDRMYHVQYATSTRKHALQCLFKQCKFLFEDADDIGRNVCKILTRTEPLMRCSYGSMR